MGLAGRGLPQSKAGVRYPLNLLEGVVGEPFARHFFRRAQFTQVLGKRVTQLGRFLLTRPHGGILAALFQKPGMGAAFGDAALIKNNDLIGIDQRLANLCAAPLMIFTFFPFAVTLRGYYHGVGIVRRMTDAMALSAPSRLTAISIALVAFSFTDVAGATMGIGALFCGFAAESSMVSWGVRRRIKKQKDGDAHV